MQSFPLCVFLLAFSFGMSIPVAAAEAPANVEAVSAPVKHARHARPTLTPEQEARLQAILKEAAPTLKETRKVLRRSERDYAKAFANGKDGQLEKEQALQAYGAVLDAEAAVRRQLQQAGLPADISLRRRAPHARPQRGAGTPR